MARRGNLHGHPIGSSMPVGARVDDAGKGGPLWSPVVGRLRMLARR